MKSTSRARDVSSSAAGSGGLAAGFVPLTSYILDLVKAVVGKVDGTCLKPEDFAAFERTSRAKLVRLQSEKVGKPLLTQTEASTRIQASWRGK